MTAWNGEAASEETGRDAKAVTAGADFGIAVPDRNS